MVDGLVCVPISQVKFNNQIKNTSFILDLSNWGGLTSMTGGLVPQRMIENGKSFVRLTADPTKKSWIESFTGIGPRTWDAAISKFKYLPDAGIGDKVRMKFQVRTGMLNNSWNGLAGAFGVVDVRPIMPDGSRSEIQVAEVRSASMVTNDTWQYVYFEFILPAIAGDYPAVKGTSTNVSMQHNPAGLGTFRSNSAIAKGQPNSLTFDLTPDISFWGFDTVSYADFTEIEVDILKKGSF